MEDQIQQIVRRAAFQALARNTPAAFRFGYDPQDNNEPQQFVHEEPQQQQHRFVGVLPFLGRLVKFGLIAAFLFSISLTSNFVLYQALMPSNRAIETLYFDYTGGTSDLSHNIITTEDDNTNKPNATTTKKKKKTATATDCVLPTASVDLFARHSSWDAMDESVLPPPKWHRRLLDPKRAYSIETSLTLPDSFVNQNAGVFTVVTQIISSNGTQLAVSRRSTRLPHQSRWISNLRKTFCLIPLLIGAVDESRTVIIPCFRHFVESVELPLQYLVVKIIPRPGRQEDPHSNDIAEINEGELVIGEEMTPFQEFLKKWFYVCMTIGTIFFASLYIVLWHALQALGLYIKRRYIDEEYIDIDFDEFVDIYPEQTDDEHHHGDTSSTAQQSNNNDEASPDESVNDATSAHNPRRNFVHRASAADFDDFDSNEWEDLNIYTRGERDGGEGLEENADQPAVVEDEAAENERRDIDPSSVDADDST